MGPFDTMSEISGTQLLTINYNNYNIASIILSIITTATTLFQK